MYPDTDSPPTRVTKERVAEARSRLRPPPWDRIARYMSWRVPEETAHYLIRRGGAEIVDAVVGKDRRGRPAGRHRHRSAVPGPEARRHSRPTAGHGRVDPAIRPLHRRPYSPRGHPGRGRAHGPGQTDRRRRLHRPGHRPAGRDAWIREADQVSFDGYRRDDKADDQQRRERVSWWGGRSACSKARRRPRKWRPSSRRSSPRRAIMKRHQRHEWHQRQHDSLQRAHRPVPRLSRSRQGEFSKNTGSACGARSR